MPKKTGTSPKNPYNTRLSARQLFPPEGLNEPAGDAQHAEALPIEQLREAEIETSAPAHPSSAVDPPIVFQQPGKLSSNQPKSRVAPNDSGWVPTQSLLEGLKQQIVGLMKEEVAKCMRDLREDASRETPRPSFTTSVNSTTQPAPLLGRNDIPPPLYSRPPPPVSEYHGYHSSHRRCSSPIRSWRLQYDGDNKRLNVEEFIFRAETLTHNTLRSDFSLLVRNFPQLLSDSLVNWYWTFLRSNPSPTWDQLRFALRADWAGRTLDVDVHRQMLGRRQQPGESFVMYYQALVNLRNQLKAPMSETDFVERVRTGLLPDIQDKLCLHRTDTIGQLRMLVNEIQASKERSRAMLSSFARPRARVEEAASLMVEPDENIETYVDAVEAVAKYQPPKPKCWNCDAEGHYYHDCDKEPTGFFCYGCGRKGTVKPRCPSCSQKNRSRVESSNTSSRPQRAILSAAEAGETLPSHPQP